MKRDVYKRQHGKRFMNEDDMQNATYLSNAVSHQKDRTGYSIVDSSIVKYYIRNGVDNVSLVRPEADVSDFIDGVKMAQENGNTGLIIADSIEELAEKDVYKRQVLFWIPGSTKR